ncbi:uncharacterized protein LOC111058631 isoform X2 [Nilaparvata lugens]|uniref:uncharacterized protein LOC111058631 isoform X2 n=1 Tax=Nilaparvata lugens TaxID=108931 RepID=UPI000B99175C|nr:uncharacterized protein LOC111058631 isoform X2 [Nilaparvata lugens]XP_039299111.1 uncharacterized protein LOC111058631 isoform X2 [Nilaparvata lugens]
MEVNNKQINNDLQTHSYDSDSPRVMEDNCNLYNEVLISEDKNEVNTHDLGPYRVTDILGKGCYALQEVATGKMLRTNQAMMKRFRHREILPEDPSKEPDNLDSNVNLTVR